MYVCVCVRACVRVCVCVRACVCVCELGSERLCHVPGHHSRWYHHVSSRQKETDISLVYISTQTHSSACRAVCIDKHCVLIMTHSTRYQVPPPHRTTVRIHRSGTSWHACLIPAGGWMCPTSAYLLVIIICWWLWESWL